uniref:Uncharacterized protein n=1 Tax=Avena sativa TaxID=4498 RepID=A0ACD5W790_AVESA
MAKLPQSSFALDFLRRLLCAHSAPGGDATAGNAARRGDDADADADAVALREKAHEGTSPARSPCIVARLMGLDAMPTPARDPHTLRRSRSASSAEGLSPPPPTPCCSPRPRVARTTSASFSDRPTYLRRENDEFLLLSFSPDDAGDDDDHLSACFSPAYRSGDDAPVPGRKQRRRRRHGEPGRSRRQAAAAEVCGTENSSPVSVLEAQEESSSTTTTTTSSSSSSSTEEAEQCSPASDGEEIRPAAPRQEQGSRRKLPQPHFEDLGGHLPPQAVSTCHVSDCSGSNRRDRRMVNNAEVVAPAAPGIWRTICRLVEDDICGMKRGGRDDANIAAEMESAILEQLICEETEELVQLTVV